MDRLNLRLSSIHAAPFSKICKYLYTPHHMSTPAFARHIVPVIGDAILFQKADRQLSGKLISEFLQTRKLDEVLPSCSIATPRSPAVAQTFDLAQRIRDKALQG
jgi:hypothetical protein